MTMSYEESLKKLPLFVSFPRCGCNWVQPVMELYFNRHRAGKVPTSPSWLETPYENPMWTHNHDPNGIIVTKFPAIFLWRNPVDAIYSLTKLFQDSSPQKIKQYCGEFRRLYDKWTKPENSENHGGQPVLILQYEKVQAEPHKQMQRISEFFDKPFDLQRSKISFNRVGDKENVNKRNGPNPSFKNPASHTEVYILEKRPFEEKWKDTILHLCGFQEE